MVIDAQSRWQLIRDVIFFEKTGVLILQWGRTYLHWAMHRGQLVCVSSTLPEHSFTQFILKKSDEHYWKTQEQINEERSLGAVLLQENVFDAIQLREMLKDHWVSLCPTLFQSSAHLFWSDRPMELKREFARTDIPFAEILMGTERNSIEIRAAVEFAEAFSGNYRMNDPGPIEVELLNQQEKRLLPYLCRRDPVEAMLTDPEVDRLTCYRALFLLWVSGLLHLLRPIAREPKIAERQAFLRRIRSVPPDWIFPLAIGILLGITLAPRPEPIIAPQSRTEPARRQSWSRPSPPAWASPEVSSEQNDAQKDP